ncbi:MAG TPA: DUF4232 domain-containing protein [Streptosporangiaceae bacterium]|nr:DUF4232 domain-containing protein [Streptosporangiaceae bacterium]
MNLTTRLTPRVLGTAALACAAVLAPAVALAAPTHGAAPVGKAKPVAAATPQCATSVLSTWLGIPGYGFAGGAAYQLETSNISHSTCTLFGYPGVSALGTGGKQLGSAAGRNASHPPALVTLQPGATAHVFLQITTVANFPPSVCQPTTAVALRVFPPNNTTAAQIPFSFQACSKAGPVYLQVTTTLSGTGIPGFSS